MALSVQSNLMAASAQRHLTAASDGLNLAMAKLSSGSRVNSAKDDAAGLQISNRLSTQSRGFEVAMRNASDAFSILQVTEGALNEYTTVITRMRDLSLQAVNGANSKDEVAAIDAEIRALGDELNRISLTSSFGGKPLLNGTQGELKFQLGSGSGEAIQYDLPNIDALNSEHLISTPGSEHLADPVPAGWRTAEGDSLDVTFQIRGGEVKQSVDFPAGEPIEGVINILNNQFEDKARFFLTKAPDESGAERSYLSYSVLHDEDTSELISFGISGENFSTLENEDGSQGQLLQTTDSSSVTGQTKHRSLFGIVNGMYQSNPDYVQNQTDKSIDRNALIHMSDIVAKRIDSFRADMGSTQNRLEKTLSNLSNQNINVVDSKSRIKDADYAKQVTKMTTEKILTDSTTSILAQANNLPKSVSSLLTS